MTNLGLILGPSKPGDVEVDGGWPRKDPPPPAGLQKKIKPGAGGALVLFLVNVNGAFFEERSPLSGLFGVLLEARGCCVL